MQAGLRAAVRHPRETADQAVCGAAAQVPARRGDELWLQFETKEAFAEKEKELYAMLHDSDGKDTVVIYISSVKAMKRLPENYSILHRTGDCEQFN